MQGITITFLNGDGKLANGTTFGASDAASAVDFLRAMSWFEAHKDSPVYMKLAARRASRLTRVPVRYDTPDHFLADLARARLVKVEPMQ